MDKCKIRRWLKDDFSTLAKYLNNKKIWDNWAQLHKSVAI